MKRVAMLVFDRVQSLDVAGPLDVFAEANGFVSPGAGYEVVLVGADGRPLRASNGMKIDADRAVSAGPVGADLLLVPGGPDLPTAATDPVISAWLAKEAQCTPRFGSICTGAFLLGRAGLLEGAIATTHWQHAQRLREQFPKAEVEVDRIYVRHGRMVTSAGVTAGIDLALALVAEDHGAGVALAVAKRLLVVTQRQGGQSQFSPFLPDTIDPDPTVERVQRHVMEHLADSLTIETLAGVVAMSPRHLARVFTRELGFTPGEFVQRARIDRARQLLEGTLLPLKTVAYRCGFGSAARMRLVFGQRLGITPAQYRDRFSHQRDKTGGAQGA
ncbi:GlxA family transcriptional regulator [Pseudomonas sp. Marseille-QA0892]